MMKSRLALTAMLLGASLGFAAPVPAATMATIAVTETITSANPYGDSVALMNGIYCQTYGCWMRWDWENGRYTSDFFDSWKTEDNLTWVFHLKPGLKRNNGEPVVAEDFVHTVERIRTDPQSRQQFRVVNIAEVQVRDPETVVLKTTVPTATLLEYLVEVIVTSKAQWDAHGKAADRDYAVGVGPYRLKALAVDDYVAIEKVPGHPLLGSDNPDQIVFKIMKEPEQRVTALLNGEVQIAQFIPPQLVQRVEQSAQAKLGWADGFEAMFVAMSPKSEPWSKKEVRQAVAYAIDRDGIAKFKGAATAEPALSVVPAGYLGTVKAKLFPHDVAKAKALLKEAGFPNGVTITAIQTSLPTMLNSMQIVQAQLKQAGITLDLQVVDHATFHAQIRKDLSMAVYYSAARFPVDDIYMTQFFHSRSTVTTPTAATNFSHCAVADKEIDAARVEPDEAKQKALWAEAQQKIVDDVCAVPLFEQLQVWAHHTKLHFNYDLKGSLNLGPTITEASTLD
jgi:peptide/nickel transport system substrate-binding protein